jgi:tetratricopeptide (TPR) repeat protein
MFKSKKITGIVFLGVLVVGGGIWGFNPTYRKVKDIRSGYLAKAAYEKYIADPFDKAGIEEAMRKAQSALFLSPDNYQANRSLAVILMFIEPQISLKYWEQSRELWKQVEPIPFRDQMSYVQALMINNKLDVAHNILTRLKGGELEQSDIDYNLAKICFLQSKKSEAIDHGRRMVENRLTPIRRHLFFVGICLDSPDPVIRKEGERHLRVLIESEDLIDDSILWDMTQFRNLSSELSAFLKEKLDGKVNAYDERIALAEYQVLNKVKKPSEAFEELTRTLSREDILAVANLVKWCSKYGLVDQALELMSAEMAIKRKDWFLLYVKNLGKKERWVDIIELLKNEDCPIEPFWSSILKAEAFYESGEEGKAVNAWYRAKQETQPLQDQYWLLIHTGDAFGLHDETAEMLDKLVSIGVQPEQVLAYICERELLSKNYDGLYDTLVAYKERYPDHPDIVNDWAYYAILMDRDNKNALEAVNTLIESNPNLLRFHMTWALAQLKLGNPRQVLSRLQQFDLDWMKLHPKWRFILALALAGVGEVDQAKVYLAGVNMDTFNPYELALYDKWYYNR